jgi:hypothetical protein
MDQGRALSGDAWRCDKSSTGCISDCPYGMKQISVKHTHSIYPTVVYNDDQGE